MPSSRGSSKLRDGTHISYVFCNSRVVLYHYHHSRSTLRKVQPPKIEPGRTRNHEWTSLKHQNQKSDKKNLTANKSPGPDVAPEYSTKSIELTPILLILFQKVTEEEKLANTVYKATISLILKRDKDNTIKENYRQISVMNIDVKISSKILANRLQNEIKRIIQHNQVGFIPGMQGFFNIYIDQRDTPYK